MSECIVEFPIFDPYNMEAGKRVEELTAIIDLIKGKDADHKTTFFRFVRDNKALKGCDVWFCKEEYKPNLPKKYRSLLICLRNLVSAAEQRKYWPDKTNEENFDLLRGLALELYIETCIKKRYSDVFSNCYVSINNNPFCHRQGVNPYTLDVVGWNSQNIDGELYECKVSTYLLNNTSYGHDKIKFLDSLQKYLASLDSKCNVAVASFENDFALKKYFSGLNITLVGYQKLLHIHNCRCGISA